MKLIAIMKYSDKLKEWSVAMPNAPYSNRWHSLITELKKIMTKIRLKGKLTKKDYLKVTIFVVTFLIAKTIFSDWRNFKAGLFGKTPISIHKNN